MRARAFHVECRLAAIDTTMTELGAFLGDALAPEGAIRLEIAVVEALTNIVLHGRLAHDAGIDLLARTAPDTVEIEIRDPGPPVPLRLFEDSADLDQIDPLAESGRGIALIKAMSDGLDYRIDRGANRLVLRFVARDPE